MDMAVMVRCKAGPTRAKDSFKVSMSLSTENLKEEETFSAGTVK